MFGKIFLDTKTTKNDDLSQSKNIKYKKLTNPSQFTPLPKKKIIKKDGMKLHQQDK